MSDSKITFPKSRRRRNHHRHRRHHSRRRRRFGRPNHTKITVNHPGLDVFTLLGCYTT